MATALGCFDEVAQQRLRDGILRQLEQCHHEKPPREVYPVQYTLMKEGNLLVPHHVRIGPGQWTRRPEVLVLNRVDEKQACLKWLLRNPGGNNNGLLLELIRGVNEELERINHGCEGLQREELVKRMLLDGCYIIYNFAKTPPRKDKRGLQGSHHDGGLLHMMLVGPCCRLITNCIAMVLDRTRGVQNARESANNNSSSRDLEVGGGGGVEMQPVGERLQQPQPQPRSGVRARWLEYRDCWCLMNNCVPYGVLDVIHRRVYGDPEGGFGGASARILLQWWSMYYYVPPPPSPNPDHIVPRNTVPAGDDANCLLILLAQLLKPRLRHSTLLNTTWQEDEEGADEQLLCEWSQATEYVRRCNARFVASPLDATERLTVLDVTATIRPGWFRSIDVLVPPLLVDGNTLALLRNLVELEQRGHSTADRRYVTAYCFFMHMIANQAEDVELLKRAGIITYISSDPMEVARGFKEVVEMVHPRDADTYLLPIHQELRRRYDSTFHRCMSWFRVSYWTKADVLALIAVLLAVPAIVYAALSYYNQAATAAVMPHPGGRH